MSNLMTTMAMFRDFRAVNDVQKMKELRLMKQEFTMYGSLFFEKGEAFYLISANQERLIDFRNQRENYRKVPLPVMKRSLRASVPSGNEEDILRAVKVKTAAFIRAQYRPMFLKDFYALAQTPNDDQAKTILDELQEKMRGLFRRDNLAAFEGLMNFACQTKHLSNETQAGYEKWLYDEWWQLEETATLDDVFQKEFFGIAYLENGKIHAYCNGVEAQTFEKKLALERQGLLVSALYKKTYWYNYSKSLADVRHMFEAFLVDLFDETYFDYLKRLAALPSCVSKERFTQLEQVYEDGSEAEKQALALYKMQWRII